MLRTLRQKFLKAISSVMAKNTVLQNMPGFTKKYNTYMVVVDLDLEYQTYEVSLSEDGIMVAQERVAILMQLKEKNAEKIVLKKATKSVLTKLLELMPAI